jgi:hypothetical protein
VYDENGGGGSSVASLHNDACAPSADVPISLASCSTMAVAICETVSEAIESCIGPISVTSSPPPSITPTIFCMSAVGKRTTICAPSDGTEASATSSSPSVRIEPS